jgi:hypothetical protein
LNALASAMMTFADLWVEDMTVPQTRRALLILLGASLFICTKAVTSNGGSPEASAGDAYAAAVNGLQHAIMHRYNLTVSCEPLMHDASIALFVQWSLLWTVLYDRPRAVVPALLTRNTTKLWIPHLLVRYGKSSKSMLMPLMKRRRTISPCPWGAQTWMQVSLRTSCEVWQ